MEHEFDSIGRLVDEALAKARAFEYRTFSVSTRIGDNVLAEYENHIKSRGLGAIAPKNRINRLAGEMIRDKTGKQWSREADLVFVLDFAGDKAEARPSPIFILGKYIKDSRELYQTRWEKFESVEGFIVSAAQGVFGCRNAFLHGAGREDLDARMLGEGRLCIIEIEAPVKRPSDFSALRESVKSLSDRRVDFIPIRKVGRELVWIVKEAKFDKVYRATVELDCEAEEEKIRKICGIREIRQRTPQRVLHRRADLSRERKIHGIECEHSGGKTAVFKITTEAGAYIKELVGGDGGRTVPSFSQAADCCARCIGLDVLEVKEYISDWY